MTEIIKSTGQLTYDGILGYAKAIVAILAGAAEAALPFIPIDSDLARWLHIIVAVLGALGVYAVPNRVKPTPPAPIDPPPGD